MKNLLLTLSIFIASFANAQNVDGYWYGTANVSGGINASNYLVELIVKQNSNSVNAVLNYYFKNTYRSVHVNGNYNPTTREITLNNIPVTYFGSTTTFEVDCMMDFRGILRTSKVESDLSGQFVTRKAYVNTCPDMNFGLKLNKEAGNHDSILLAIKNFKETYQVWRPSANDTLVASTVIQRPVVNYVIANQFKERENFIAEEIEVDADSVLVDFYDNGEVDGDSISVFYNNQLLAFNRRLSTKAIHFSLRLDSTKVFNDLTMFADNLGSLPPNTALMIVYDGKKRYEVRLSSNLQKNATVRIKRKKK